MEGMSEGKCQRGNIGGENVGGNFRGEMSEKGEMCEAEGKMSERECPKGKCFRRKCPRKGEISEGKCLKEENV